MTFWWIPGYPDWWSCTAWRSATAQVGASFLSWLGCPFIQDHKLWSEGYHTGMFLLAQLYHYHVSTHKDMPSKDLQCWICISLVILCWQKLKRLVSYFWIFFYWGPCWIYPFYIYFHVCEAITFIGHYIFLVKYWTCQGPLMVQAKKAWK